MADAFLQNFVALPNVEERTEALIKLAAVLSVAERTTLVDTISGRSDLVPTLPFELLIQVFKHLHIHDAWSLQLVNRRWRTALSSDQLLRTALRRWDTHDPSDSARSAEDIAHDSIADRIRHMQSLRLGKPFSQVELYDTGIGLQEAQHQWSPRKYNLKGRKIAYISSKPSEGDAVVLRDLVTGSVSLFHGDARERILSLALSTDLIAFVTFDGYLHIARFTDPGWSTRRRLPSARVRALGVDGSTVAVAMGQNGCNIFQIAEVLIFDAVSQRLRKIDVFPDPNFFEDPDLSVGSYSILVDDEKKVIDLFSLVLYSDVHPIHTDRICHQDLEIWHLRITFTGECAAIGSQRHTIGEGNERVRGDHATMAPPAPTGYPGLYRIHVGTPTTGADLPIRLQFGARFDAGRSDEDPSICALFSDNDVPTHDEVIESPNLFDRFFQDSLRAQWKTVAIQAAKQPDDNWLQYYSLMNDTFLVSLGFSATRVQDGRIRVFCFDSKVDLHGGRSTGFWRDGELQPVP